MKITHTHYKQSIQARHHFLCKLLTVSCLLLSMIYGANTFANIWEPSPGLKQVPIWPEGKMPDPVPDVKPESMELITDRPIAGLPWNAIYNVSKPTMTVYSPQAHNTGTAVVVFPGGGFNGLAIDLEGTEVCTNIASMGITCVLLKYRVPDSGPAWHDDCECNIHPIAPTALQDAQRTISLVRMQASKWNINPDKIGVLGFSAGGYMVADISTHFTERAYQPIDAADKVSCRPDFAVALYPGHLWTNEDSNNEKLALNPDIKVTAQTPPTLLIQAQDDKVDNINHSLTYYIALKNNNVLTEMHLYAEGGHGFGVRPTNLSITNWPKLFDDWLGNIPSVKN